MHAIKMSLAKPSYEDGGWLIEEVLGLGSGTILYGPPGVGKTNIVCTMLAALEAGGTWAGQRVHGSQHKVIYLDLDASQAQTMPRAWAAYNSLGVTAGGKENLFYISRLEEQCLVPGDPKELGEAIALMVKTMGASLVIVDSFLQIRTGDSNNADAVREACQLVFDPARKLGAAVLVLDHNSKPSVANPSGGKE